MAFVEARTGPPPQVPQNVSQDCQQNQRVYLCITVRNAHEQNTPVMGGVQVRVTVGAENHELDTDQHGLVTFVYEQVDDLHDHNVEVRLTDDRGWEGSRPTAQAQVANNVHQVAVTVQGTFSIKVNVATLKPGEGQILWSLDWTDNLQLRLAATPPGGRANVSNVGFRRTSQENPSAFVASAAQRCMTRFKLSVGFRGFLNDGTRIRMRINGQGGPVDTNERTHDGVTFKSVEDNGLELTVRRHGTKIEVCFVFAFPQVLIIGEGTNFEYAVGLATKFGDALNDRGFKWVVATQYDVTPVHDVPENMRIRNWQNNNWINGANQRQNVQNAQVKNLVIRNAQFDATNANHWTGIRDAYGRFDAVVFNNPHPGYGMHMCSVMGLTTHEAHRDKNGRCISVYSIGYHNTLTDVQRNAFTGFDFPERCTHHRRFVRTNNHNCLNYQNDTATQLDFQYEDNDSTMRAVTIAQGFQYREGGDVIGVGYGTANEFQRYHQERHYRSCIDTIGLHEYLLRAYRHHGRMVLKPGGWLMINGSQIYNDRLTVQFTFNDGENDHVVPAMTNYCLWRDYDATFVWYNTNFTSMRHHPSWYAKIDFNPGEPNLGTSRCYRWQAPTP